MPINTTHGFFFLLFFILCIHTTATINNRNNTAKRKLIYVRAIFVCSLSIVFAFFPHFIFFYFSLPVCNFIGILFSYVYTYLYTKTCVSLFFLCSIANWERIIERMTGKSNWSKTKTKWYNFAMVNYGKVSSMCVHIYNHHLIRSTLQSNNRYQTNKKTLISDVGGLLLLLATTCAVEVREYGKLDYINYSSLCGPITYFLIGKFTFNRFTQ